MRLRHIEVFHAIYSTGSITNAAKFLNVSQPSVSKVLAHAEIQLGFKLFDRVKGRLIATSEADLLFVEADRIYQQIGTINDMAENIQNNDMGEVSVAISPALGFDIMPSAITQFRNMHPNTTFDIKTIHNDDALTHLLRHKSDVAILFSPEHYSGIEEICFGEGKMMAMYPKSLLPHQPEVLSLQEIFQHPHISIWNSGPLAELIWTQVVKQNIVAQDAVKVKSYFIAASLVKYGAGICIIDEFTARAKYTDEVGIAELQEPIKYPIKGLFTKNKCLAKVTDNFLQSLQQSFTARL